MTAPARERGVVLLVVVFFALLLASAVATFVSRSTVDAAITRNRESAAQAEALARGGIQLGEALLLEDLLQEGSGAALPLDTGTDVWAEGLDYPLADGSELHVRIADTGARLNLNALFAKDAAGELVARKQTEPFLVAVLQKAIQEIPRPPSQLADYDPAALAANLIDFVDTDSVRVHGGPEDSYYSRLDPPLVAGKDKDHPLFSVEDLRLVEGFDQDLIEALRPYVSVYPYAAGGCDRANVGCGINLNTAPPHVLSLLYYDDGVELRLAPEDVVRRILQIRSEGGAICPAAKQEDGCTPIGDLVTNAIFPPPTFSAVVFVVTAEARVRGVRRTIEAVVDRSKGAELRLLSWQIH
jgi:type II secretory pathway component PulK